MAFERFMRELKDVDLRRDPEGRSYIKSETVQVQFAETTGELISREGPNRYAPGDALITGSTGDRWCVSRERFNSKYEPVAAIRHGEDGAYRNKPIPVLAKQMREPFCIARSTGGDVLRGAAQDWLMQYGPGDFGITENARFQKIYRPAEAEGN